VNIEFSSTIGKSYKITGSGTLQSWFSLLELNNVTTTLTEADLNLGTFFNPLPTDYYFRVEEAIPGGGD
jgi:hypothetical protein